MDVILERRINLKRQLDYFIKKHPIACRKLEGAKVIYSQAHLIGFPGVLKDNVVNGCLIAGDASGTVSNVMGEGIWYSMKSGEAAGLSAAETLEKDDVSAKTLRARYDQNLDQTVKDDLRLAFKIRRRFLNTDAQQQRSVVSVAKDKWWADLVVRTIDGTSSYKKFIRQTWSRPDKVLKTLLFHR
jgi:flavin-dependent dehydrogenase